MQIAGSWGGILINSGSVLNAFDYLDLGSSPDMHDIRSAGKSMTALATAATPPGSGDSHTAQPESSCSGRRWSRPQQSPLIDISSIEPSARWA